MMSAGSSKIKYNFVYLIISLDAYDDANEFLYGRRSILAKVYAANLKRFIFNQYDEALQQQNMDGHDAELSAAVDDVTNNGGNQPAPDGQAAGGEQPLASAIKKEPVFLNDPDLVITIDDLVLVDENDVDRREWTENLFEQIAEAVCDNDYHVDNGHEAQVDDGNHNGASTASQRSISSEFADYEERVLDAAEPHNASLGHENTTTKAAIKSEEPIVFLNLPNEVLDVSDDLFDALREEIAYDGDSDNSLDELKKEFDHLIKDGKTLPPPLIVKVESETESISQIAQNDIEAVPIGDSSATNVGNLSNPNESNESDAFTAAEYANSEVEDGYDPVLGNIPRKVNVSI